MHIVRIGKTWGCAEHWHDAAINCVLIKLRVNYWAPMWLWRALIRKS